MLELEYGGRAFRIRSYSLGQQCRALPIDVSNIRSDIDLKYASS